MDSRSELLGKWLESVSRSFYLTLRILPRSIRPQIGLAYLLARITDTIADTDTVPLERRLDALRALRDRVLGARGDPVDFNPLISRQTAEPERVILAHAEQAVQLLNQFTPADQQRIRRVLTVISSGQELDLTRFGAAPPGSIEALESDHDLDDYTYRVAGCVGEFWTTTCRAHLFPNHSLDDSFLLETGVRFGKGLQLVNILRDLPRDLRQGRCYVPASRLAQFQLSPNHLLDNSNEPRFRPLFNRYVEAAQDHLAAGWQYTLALPGGCARVRLACAWPILIGVRTLAKLRQGKVLDPDHRIKVSRTEVKKWILLSLGWYPWRKRWARLFDTASG